MSRQTFQMMTADELEDAPQADGLLAYEREPIHLSLGVTIENLVKVCGMWSCRVFLLLPIQVFKVGQVT